MKPTSASNLRDFNPNPQCSIAACPNGIESVKNNAPDALVVEMREKQSL